MKFFRYRIWVSLLLFTLLCLPAWASVTNPKAISRLLDRIGGKGASSRFVTVVDEKLAENGSDVFFLTSRNGKPCIQGSSTLAVATGINWYLNHTAHINLTWNNLTTDLTKVQLPLPADEKRTCHADYRYYLNYCTFSYSMSVWTWERWEQEIDWMALHGINMPLQIVGLDVVWYKLLTRDLGYSSTEAARFIAGPCFQAWWGMNNLEGWGGPNPEWWYKRQENLAHNIVTRQRELGMDPVLPGYSGMIPSDIATRGYNANSQGNWCSFVRPYILDPNSAAFTEISAKYYKRLKEVMGTSTYYSMDPFHEGANTQGIDVPSAYKKIAQAMMQANREAKWVIQSWQWNRAQYHVLDQVPHGRLVILDLFSDAHTHFDSYKGHDAVYCMLANFGGRSGIFGRLTKVMNEYFAQRATHPHIKGIGATPEAIEQVPVLYDALFELPWREAAPDAKEWLTGYTVSRYGAVNAEAQAAWEKMRNSALNCETALQGPHEAVFCGRPALQMDRVSSWGGTGIFYDAQDVADAAFLLLQAKNKLSGPNYSYDLTDFTRQALTDYGYYLLKGIKEAHDANDSYHYRLRRDAFLKLMLDLDELLNTNRDFMLGRWTRMAREIADEVKGTTDADRNWLELDNARTLITTWGHRDASEYGGLRDYSYRAWGGMMKDFYYERWKTFFHAIDNATPQPDWFKNDSAWAHNTLKQYADTPEGKTEEVAARLLNNYFLTLRLSEGNDFHLYRFITNDAGNHYHPIAYRGKIFRLPLNGLPEGTEVRLGIDLNNNGTIDDNEIRTGTSFPIPAKAMTGQIKANLLLNDGTSLSFTLLVKDHVTAPRKVRVKTADAKQGCAVLTDKDQAEVTTKDDVRIKAIPATGYDFLHWTNEAGTIISTDTCYTYRSAADITLTAHFIQNPWGKPEEDRSEMNVVAEHGQYISSLKYEPNGGTRQILLTTDTPPATLYQVTAPALAVCGSQLRLHWQAQEGLNYCNLTAYLDLNADGDFTDKGELIRVEGQKASADNRQLNDYTLEFVLPYDIPEGMTRLRLRLDGAWAEGFDTKSGAMPANASTKRMVYDIPLRITARATSPATITVRSSNTQQGTVDANGQPETYTYKPGEEIVLRCYPTAGYMLDYWSDSYGRKVPSTWYDGRFLRFRALENNTYTANFKRK